MPVDIAITTSGDIAVGPNGDVLDLGDDVLAQRQSALITLLVSAPDFDCFPNFGANLEDLLGLDVSDTRTIELAENLVLSSIPDVDDIQVVANNEQNAMTLIIFHPDFERPVVVVFSLDEGILAGDAAENLLHEAFSQY